jgi:hypothetical protein
MSRAMSGSPKTAFGTVAKVIAAVGMVTAPEDRATPKTIDIAEIRAVIDLVIGVMFQAYAL